MSITIPIKGGIRLAQTDLSRLRVDLMQAWLSSLNAAVQSRLSGVVSRIKDAVREALLDAPEWKEIKPGGLYYGEFGLTDADERIAALVNKLVDGIGVRLKPFSYNGKQLAGKITIEGIRVDLAEVMGEAEAVLISEHGKVWQWLNALCFSGDSIVIQDYVYLSDVISDESRERFSRTHEGFMVRRDGQGWRVPTYLSGTANDNVVTRALNASAVTTAVEQAMMSLLT